GLLKELRALNLSTELHDRIDYAIKRRNALVHRTFEDPDLARAVSRGCFEGPAERINQLAIDCGELAVELEAFAIPNLEAALGMSRFELVELVKSIDLSTFADARSRKQLEAIQAFADLDSLLEMLGELGIGDVPKPD